MYKRRTALGRAKNDGTITGLRLQNFNANLHLENFQDLDPASEEAFLRNFDLAEEARWSKRFAEGFAGRAAELEPFNCFVEKFEDRTKTTLSLWRTSEIEFKIKAKWLGLYCYYK